MNRTAALTARAAAIAIAVVAVLDPAITLRRAPKPVIAVLADTEYAAAAARIADQLRTDFRVMRAPLNAAAATVIVGDVMIDGAREVMHPVFAVLPDSTRAAVSIGDIDTPGDVPLEARVPVNATIRVRGARAHTLVSTLRRDGVAIDHSERAIDTDDGDISVSLTFVPTVPGASVLRWTASIDGGSATTADVVIDVRDQRWPILFFDPRPSWMSTFVRRALERDPRFATTSRIVTSRGISADAGAPPALADLLALGAYSTIVVGAPESLSERDDAALDAFMRRRGGGVVLLYDQQPPTTRSRLTNVAAWSHDQAARPITLEPADGDSTGLRATEIISPAPLPAGSVAVASTVPAANPNAGSRAVVWRIPVGAGVLVTSGALDAWKFRDTSVSGFDAFWQRTIAALARSAMPSISVDVAPGVVMPGAQSDVRVTLRDVALARREELTGIHATIAGSVEGGVAPIALRLWPEGSAGAFHARIRAPDVPGDYRVVVRASGVMARAPLIVRTDARQPLHVSRDALSAFASSHGGATFVEGHTNELGAAIARVVRATPTDTRWHPMRSPWWIVPFAGLLFAEWIWRRRRGHA